MLNRLLGQKLLHLLLNLQELDRRLDDAVEQKGKVHEECETDDLEPLERLPAEAERDDPDEERTARVNRGAGGGADAARDGEAEKVEATENIMLETLLVKGRHFLFSFSDQEGNGRRRSLTQC